MGISSSADYAGIKDDFDEPELMSQVIAPARARTPSPSLQSGPPPSYDAATKAKKVLILSRLTSGATVEIWHCTNYVAVLCVFFV